MRKITLTRQKFDLWKILPQDLFKRLASLEHVKDVSLWNTAMQWFHKQDIFALRVPT